MFRLKLNERRRNTWEWTKNGESPRFNFLDKNTNLTRQIPLKQYLSNKGITVHVVPHKSQLMNKINYAKRKIGPSKLPFNYTSIFWIIAKWIAQISSEQNYKFHLNNAAHQRRNHLQTVTVQIGMRLVWNRVKCNTSDGFINNACIYKYYT